MSYVIEQNFIQGLPNVPFRYGRYEGVVGHCTDSANHSGGDTPTNERSFESRTFNNAFVHGFVGVENNQPKIIQCAPLTSGAYGAGKTANSRYLHLELCMYDDPNKFKMAYDAWVWVTAKWLYDGGLGVQDNVTLLSHKEVADDWHETTHSDPIVYLGNHGISWAQHVSKVASVYNSFRVIQPQTPSSGQFLVKVLAGSLYYYNKADWNAKAGMVTKGQVFTVVQTLWVNGSKMYKLKSGNYLTANPSYVQVI
jgi:N-acetylmuramoyl-L-alanine amidase CwlA